MATKAVAGTLGLSPETSEDDLSAAVACASPDDLLKLKQADFEFKTKMKELDVDLERIASEDRSSAREREKTVRDRIPGVLSIFLTIGFFGVFACMLWRNPPPGSKDVLNVMLGSLGTGWIRMLAYYFGSSAESVEKNVILDKVIGNGKSNVVPSCAKFYICWKFGATACYTG
ncbi:MAG: hypothetical protein AB9866_20370 [Syntrophobacteraceae bacterium]